MPGISTTVQVDPSPSTAQASWFDAYIDAIGRLPGRIIVSWCMGGGVVAGGLLVALLTLARRLSSSAIPQLSLILFVLGAGAGLAHGGLLGYLSRDPARTRAEVLGVLLRSLLWAVPGLLAAWAAAFWISLTAAIFRSSGVGVPAAVGLVLAWIFGLLICGWAASEGVRGLIAAWRRWPDFRIASVSISVVFAVLATLFVTTHPQIWWTDVRVTGIGAFLLALGATLWIALPVVIAALSLVHRLARRVRRSGS